MQFVKFCCLIVRQQKNELHNYSNKVLFILFLYIKKKKNDLVNCNNLFFGKKSSFNNGKSFENVLFNLKKNK
jgi:hypothetical protein